MRINYPKLRNMANSLSFDFVTAFEGTNIHILFEFMVTAFFLPV